MTKPDWNIFKAKFGGKEQTQFEWLCYLLFCKKFNRSEGISRYINQAGIETNPIDVNGEEIGWQAKFCKNNLSKYKKDFKKSIDTTKDRYSSINKIFFYTNQDFGQSPTGTNPQYKLEIESYAQSKDIKIEWRTSSYFESPFVCEENERIAQHFFNLEKSIFDFINELSARRESILYPIQSEIIYKESKIKIDRSNTVKNIKNILEKSSALILTGTAGSGKTAIIKDFYNSIKQTNVGSFFIFNALEFDISHINELFKHYGNYTLLDFVKVYHEDNKKYIIIDSAEKISDIENLEPFNSFLYHLFKNKWKIIFTTRDNYFNELHQLLQLYRIETRFFNIQEIKRDKLIQYSENYNFNLPINQKLLKLLRIPFYLNEYLQLDSDITQDINYSRFQKIIWEKKILNTSYGRNDIHIKREKCFLKIAQKRADENVFFVEVDDSDKKPLQALKNDEIIKYDSQTGRYFIAHDIYEEWALNKIIERGFYNKENYKDFYQNIGSSLSIRRAFRNWLSEKLFMNDKEVKKLIEYTIRNRDVEHYWQDEILISVLLSDYCSNFFKLFEAEFLKVPVNESDENQSKNSLLYKTFSLLKVACKTVDEDMLISFGLSNTGEIADEFKPIFVKPKGKGWNCIINFVNKYKEHFGLHYINLILPVIEDWNTKNKKGETTKAASQLALFYYEKIIYDGNSFRYGDYEKRIIKIILNGSSEIKEELKNIFQKIISENETDHNSKYYQLVHTILVSPIEVVEGIKNFPTQVIQFANLFWTHKFKKKELTLFEDSDSASDQNFKLEECFSITNNYEFRYFPSNALNTPIFFLLQYAYDEAINFILSFVNQSIENFARSKLKNQLKEVKIFIDEKTSVTQYANYMLWHMYRGSSQAPELLESIHMALEKYLLNYGESVDSSVLEKRLLYLLEKSKSVSISALVTSIVLAYPEKTFNVAKVLFKTKQFFLYDQRRWALLDQYSMNKYLNSIIKEPIFRNERIKSDKLEHRKKSLEHLALQYQFFKIGNVSEQEVIKRKKVLWEIFDNHYKQIPNQNNEMEEDKTWRFCLARMDGQKMNPIIEKKDGQCLIKFKTQLPSELEKHSQTVLKNSSKQNKYAELRLWAEYKSKKNDEYKKYIKYEDNIELVITETKDILNQLKNIPGNFSFPFFSKSVLSIQEYRRRLHEIEQDDEHGFRAINHSTPLYTCSVLIRDYFNKLTQENKNFCQNTIMQCIFYAIQDDNPYTTTDGINIAISMLPFLLELFPDKKKEIKLATLKLLIKNNSTDVNNHIIRAVVNIWEKSFEDAYSLFLGYLLLKSKFDDLISRERKHNFQYESSGNEILEILFKKCSQEVKGVIENKLVLKTVFEDIKLSELNLYILLTSLELLPFKLKNKECKNFLRNSIPIVLEKLFRNKNNEYNIELSFRFFEKISYCVLNSEQQDIELYLKPFVEKFDYLTKQEIEECFFKQFIFAQDRINQYENFWIIWEYFYPKIVGLCKSTQLYYIDMNFQIISNYLLAGVKHLWKEGTTDWHTLKNRDYLFFKKASKDMKHHPATLYSISKVLNNIGSKFIDEGIFWISNIIQENKNLSTSIKTLEENTIFYMENLIRWYILKNRKKIKIELDTKEQVLIILNFLIEKGSATAYRLREDIL